MKTTALLVLLVGSVSAFAPSASKNAFGTSLSMSPDLQGIVGASEETGGVAWDPLDVSDWAPVEQLRKAELANGRVAMLATVGWIFPRYYGHFDGDLPLDKPIAAAKAADLQWWAQFVALCGVFELYKYTQEQNGKTYTPMSEAGTPVYDIMGLYPKDEDKRKKMELAELKNARLAMIGIAGFAAADIIPGSVPWAPFA